MVRHRRIVLCAAALLVAAACASTTPDQASTVIDATEERRASRPPVPVSVPVTTTPRSAVPDRSIAVTATAPAVDCDCEVWDHTVPPPTRQAFGVAWRAAPTIAPIEIGPVIAVFGDSITTGAGVGGPAWADLLQEWHPEWEIRRLERFGLTLRTGSAQNMVDFTGEGGAGRDALVGVDTAIYVSGFNDFHHVGGDVDHIAEGLGLIHDNLSSSDLDNFFLLPMLPVSQQWAERTAEPGPGGPVMEWITAFNERVVADGVAVPFDPGFDRDGDPHGYGDPDVYAGFWNTDDAFADTGGVDGVHPGLFGHRRLAERIDEMLTMAERVGVPNVGRGGGAGSSSAVVEDS